MDEAEWLACEDWRPMLGFLAGRLTQRKATLYICAGLRHIWELLYPDHSPEVVQLADPAPEWATTPQRLRSRTVGTVSCAGAVPAGSRGGLAPAGALAPARPAVPADAFEDAGCADADILSHLRGPGPHVRGCWALDLLLGKS